MILIGVPCADTIKSKTAFSLFNIARSDTALVMQRGADIAANRNKLATLALDFTHLLFVDADMQFNPDTLTRMLAHDKDILGLAANHKRLPLESVVKPLKLRDINKPLPTSLFQAASCGTGMMLIKSRVFQKIPAPWFEFTYNEQGERVSEDVYFCQKASRNGISIWVDPTIPIKHLGDYAF